MNKLWLLLFGIIFFIPNALAASAEVWTYSLLSVFIVSIIALVGVIGLAIAAPKMHILLLFLVSFSAGALLGDAFFHLLPEATEESGFSLAIAIPLLTGILFFFILEKFIHWNHCHQPHSKTHVHSFAIVNLVGDAFHNFLDGVIIAGSYFISIPVGIATTLAVILHEIPQEIGDFGILIHGGFSRSKALLFNFLSGLVAIVGVIISLSLEGYIGGYIAFLIPFTAGSFIYIATADLIPEIHKETKISRSALQLCGFVLGLVVMVGLLALE